MTYEESLAALSALAPRGWRLGLDRMAEFAHRAGLAEALAGRRPKYIQVAGTNGKGSVTAMLQALLVAQGHRTGAFFSPYVVDPRERVQVDLDLLDKSTWARLTQELLRVAEQMESTPLEGPTEFEVKTALGIAAWKEAGCDWVALEVGLGGRLDATSVVTPAAGVVVSIGWDHMHILGESVEKIAWEKAGIAKPGMPLVVGDVPSGARAVIRGVGRERGCPLWEWGREVRLEGTTVHLPTRSFEGLCAPLTGPHQSHNMALAVAALEVAGALLDPERIAPGLAMTRIPGRFQEVSWRGRRLIVDGAHNVSSAEALAETLAQQGLGSLHLITGMLRGHEPLPFYARLAPFCCSATFVPINDHRAHTADELVERCGALFSQSDLATNPIAAIEATPEGATVLVTGSFYLAGEVLRAIIP